MSASFTIELCVAAMRVSYVEPHRHVLLRLELDPAGEWLLRPATAGWWENRHGVRHPLTDDERAVVVERVVTRVRERHHLWINVAGRPPEPRPASWPDAPPLAVDPDLLPDFHAAVGIADPAEPDAARVFSRAAPERLLAQVDAALTRIQPLADQGWAQAQSIARQLHWCRGTLRGEVVEKPPGPFSMGLIATREFDMYGSDPDLARLINDIQDAMRQRGFP